MELNLCELQTTIKWMRVNQLVLSSKLKTKHAFSEGNITVHLTRL